MEMSLNFSKSGNVLEKILPVKNPLRKKPMNKYYACRRKRIPMHSLDISCRLKFKYKWVNQMARRGEEAVP